MASYSEALWSRELCTLAEANHRKHHYGQLAKYVLAPYSWTGSDLFIMALRVSQVYGRTRVLQQLHTRLSELLNSALLKANLPRQSSL